MESVHTSGTDAEKPEGRASDSSATLPLEPVKSAALSAYGYDSSSQTLYVQFHSGHVSAYVEAPPETWAAFQKAESKGRFFAREVRGKYVGEKMTGACDKCGDIGVKGARCSDCGSAYYAR